MDESKFWVMHVPVLCTSHITQATSYWLAGQVNEGKSVFARLWSYDEGFVLFVGDCEANDYADSVPADLLPVLQWCEQHGFEWLRLDQAGDEIDALPMYDW